MKTKWMILPLFILVGLGSKAQLNPNTPVSSEKMLKELPAKLITQFYQSLKPTSMAASFAKEKKTFSENISNNDNSAEGIAKNISFLAGFIKPDLFKPGFDLASFKNRAVTANKMNSSISMLKDLEAGLKPEALSDAWKLQKSGWLADMNKIK